MSGARDPKVVENIDRAYFFTGVLSHKTYYLFIDLLREKDIPFGYLGKVNVRDNVRQIYQDLFGKEK